MKTAIIVLSAIMGSVLCASEVRYSLGDSCSYSQEPIDTDPPIPEGVQRTPAGVLMCTYTGNPSKDTDVLIGSSRSEIRLFRGSEVVETYVGDRNEKLLRGAVVEFGPYSRIQYFRSFESNYGRLVVYDRAGRLILTIGLIRVEEAEPGATDNPDDAQ